MSTADRSAADRSTARPGSITLATGDASVDVAPSEGGRIAQIRAGGVTLLVDVPSDTSAGPMQWGSFPMAPWAGRIREGRFSFAGTVHQLATNHHDGADEDGRCTHSIHGTVFTRPWSVDATTATSVTMSCPLEGALDWPFAGTATQRIEVSTGAVRCELSVTSLDASFPAVVGWHPWFRTPDRLEFAPRAMYVRDRFGIPTGELVEPPPGPWDDCFRNDGPVALVYDRDTVSRVIVTSDCDHWVVFDELEHSTCVEPQSGPPDAFNLGRDGDPSTVDVVDPSTPLRRTMTISW